ncbi:MAG: AI-2E family transporter [Pseudomonadota bacterium]
MEHVFFFTLLIVTTLAFLGLLNAFIVPVFWAIALAVVFEPLNDRVAELLGGRGGVASIMTILLVLVAIVLPLTLIGVVVSGEVTRLITAVEDGSIDLGRGIRWARDQAPLLFEYAERIGLEPDGLRERLSNMAIVTGQWIAGNAVTVGQSTVRLFVSVMLMIYILFFLLKDGHEIVRRLVQILPLGDEREHQLFGRFSEVVRATIRGTFVISAIQGFIGGVAFALLGIDGAILWGVVMAILSLLPVVGAVLVWGPAAGILIANGDLIKGIGMIVIGIGVIGLVDNLLRPLLVGRDTRMPDYLILLATLGGLAMFGATGLVIGPLIAALFITLWEMFEQSYGDREYQRYGAAATAAEAATAQPAATDDASTLADPGSPSTDGTADTRD